MSTIVISVGTSLLINNTDAGESDLKRAANTLKKKFADSSIDTETINEISFHFEEGKLFLQPEWITEGETGSALANFSKTFFNYYLSKETIERNIRHRDSNNQGDRLPAEISSLYLYYYKVDGNLRKEFSGATETEKDKVILLTTDTPDAFLCAKMLKEMIERVELFNRLCEFSQEEPVVIIENLDVNDPEKWAQRDLSVLPEDDTIKRGIRNLQEYFVQNFLNSENEDDKVLIRTGGYKEFSADLKLMAFQFGFTSLYLFENSTVFLESYIDHWPENLDEAIRSTQCPI